MKSFNYLVLIIALLHWPSCRVSKKISSSTPVSHDQWTTLLSKHVSPEGYVDYEAFLIDSAQLNQYLQLLSSAHPNDEHWSREEQLAYWINAYNAFTVKLIVDHYPVASIKDIKNGIPFVNTVWDMKFIDIEGHLYDLNNIEHGIIRKHFDEPRIHFAVNCASISCPKLLNQAYLPDHLEEQLTEATKGFLSDPTRNNIAEHQLSSIFSWFKGDFTKSAGSLISFVNQYSTHQLPENAKLTFLDYNWQLNEVPR